MRGPPSKRDDVTSARGENKDSKYGLGFNGVTYIDKVDGVRVY